MSDKRTIFAFISSDIFVPAFMFQHTQQIIGSNHTAKIPPCAPYRAYFRLTPESKVRIFFPKRSMPKDVIQMHFGKGQFEMPFNLDLPSDVLHKLGIDAYKIQSGLYPIQEDLEFIRVDF